MNFLEEVPAVRRIDTDRADLFAVEIVGHVTAADAENLLGLLQAACALHERVDALVRLTGHDGTDWPKIPKETIEQGKAEAIRHIGRCAAIGEPDWTAALQGFLAPRLPIEFRHFAAEDESRAWQWLAARPVEG
ncbi:MAG: STAS/SEC14 domain-containing protein, partial [Parvibaculum sp.]|uniref:STAS/SEC14 domain-containing protein n=1 Tax=Parvibaculum sp. TaxID=2024848 RepID=UPI003C72024B